MVVFLLLVIIAILLFGAGAVLGVIAWIAALIVGGIAILYLLGIWIGLSTMAKIVAVASPFAGVVIGLILLILAPALSAAAGKVDSAISGLARPSRRSKQKALQVWQSLDQSIIDRFSRAALREAHEALRGGKVDRMIAIYEAECERIRERVAQRAS